MTYGAVGSGAGITAISGKTVDFGASDAPLTSTQAAACSGCIEIPWALAGTGLSYNLSGMAHLNLSGPVIADIFLGTITNWNDPQIQKLNKGETLPSQKITPVYRSDGSGDTYAFTSYLSKVSPTWASKVGFGTSVSFPAGTGGKGNSGVAAVVAATPGAIGNNSWFYIRQAGLKAVAVQNSAGKFVYPYDPYVADAAALVKNVPNLSALSSSTADAIAKSLSHRRSAVQQTEEGQEADVPPEGGGGGVPDGDVHLRHRPARQQQHRRAQAVHRVRPDQGGAEQGRNAPVRAAASGGRRGGHQGGQRAVAHCPQHEACLLGGAAGDLPAALLSCTRERVPCGTHAASRRRARGQSGVPLLGGRLDAVRPMRHQSLRLEAVAEARVGMDVAPVRHRLLELCPQLAHIDVDGAIARAQLAAPDRPAELLASDDPARVLDHRDEQLELAPTA